MEENDLELFSVIWLNNNDDDMKIAEQDLRSIINRFKKFHDVKDCQNYIENKLKQDRLMLIVDNQSGVLIVPLVYSLQQVSAIYIFDHEPINEPWIHVSKKVQNFILNSIKENFMMCLFSFRLK